MSTVTAPVADRSTRTVVVLASAYAVSTYGTFLNLLALGLFALHVTGSALSTGLFMAVRLAAGFLMGPLAGLLAGRYSRRYLMIGADLLSAGTLGLLVAAPVGVRPALLWPVAVVLGAGQTLWGVALRSSLPDLVAADQLTRANSRLVTARSVAMLLGFASAGLLVARVGYSAAFLLDAATYLVSALLLVTLRRRWGPAPAVGRGAGARRAGDRRALLRVVGPVVVGMIGVRAADAFGSASHNVGLPVYANLVRPDDPAGFAATFTTAWAVGSLVAGRWVSWRSRRGSGVTSERSFGLATCAMSVFFVLAFTGLPLWLLVPVAVAAGAADGYAEISYTTRLQGAPADRRAALFGFASAAQNAGFGLGMVGCAALLDRYAPLPVIAVAHGAALATALAFLLLAGRLRRRPDRRDQSAPQPVEVT
ncbi:MFS transporter [Micromonospora echinofusca]|uniref:MFS transporter n=1 Tax=Micromonospora echinofusca TaxID=47858 RepID=A0ABS3VK20_MICEH|nr:MFS transporter [Micromonospora echinofusca]MBO4204875.1 MFS transporter [Micromonospora echinofusca]